jgi:hypothetical protein
MVSSTIANPQQTVASKRSRVIFQSKCHDRIENKEMLLRVIVEPEGGVLKVISVYRTSKIDKYWIREVRS